MKKYILFFLAFISISATAYSQITKGNWLVGGNVSFLHTNSDVASFAHYKKTILSMSPNIGYFVADKLCTGVKLSFTSFRYQNPSPDDGGISYPSKYRLFNAGPFLRYYFFPTDNAINLFAEGVYQFQVRTDIAPNSTTHQNANAYAFNAGPVFFLNSVVGVEFTIGYSSMKYQSLTGRENTIQTNLGLQIHLERDNN